MLERTPEYLCETEQPGVAVAANPHATRQRRNKTISIWLSVCDLALAVLTIFGWDSFTYENAVGLVFLIMLCSIMSVACWYRCWEQRD